MGAEPSSSLSWGDWTFWTDGGSGVGGVAAWWELTEVGTCK